MQLSIALGVQGAGQGIQGIVQGAGDFGGWANDAIDRTAATILNPPLQAVGAGAALIGNNSAAANAYDTAADMMRPYSNETPQVGPDGLTTGYGAADTGAFPRMPNDPALSFGEDVPSMPDPLLQMYQSGEIVNDTGGETATNPAAVPSQQPQGGTQSRAPSSGGSAGTGASPLGGIFGEYQAMIQGRIDGMAKEEERSKWLMVAKFGAGLMASKGPTLGISMGEAASAALEDYENIKAQNRDEMWQMQEALMGLKMRQAEGAASAAARARSGSGSGTGVATLDTSFGYDASAGRSIDDLRAGISIIDDRIKQVSGSQYEGGPVIPTEGMEQVYSDLMRQRDALTTKYLDLWTTQSGQGSGGGAIEFSDEGSEEG